MNDRMPGEPSELDTDLDVVLRTHAARPADIDALIRLRARERISRRSTPSAGGRSLATRLAPLAAVVLLSIGIVPLMLRERSDPAPPPAAEVAESSMSDARVAQPAAAPSLADPMAIEGKTIASRAVASDAAADLGPGRIEEADAFAMPASAGGADAAAVREIRAALRDGEDAAAMARYRRWREERVADSPITLPDDLDGDEAAWFERQASRYGR